MLKHLAGVAALALAIGTAACGDDENGESGGEDFLTQINAICEDSTQQVIESNLELGYATDPKDQAELAERVLEIREQSTEEIAALEPPEEDAEAFDDLLAAREDLIKAGEDRLAAVESGDEAQIQKSSETSEKAGDAEDEAAEALGADSCDGVLPEEDAQAAEDVVREFVTTADPATSCDPEEGLVTEAFFEAVFGDAEKCEKEQEALTKNPEDLAEDIKVTGETTGVDGLAASFEFEDQGGMFDGEPARATVYYLDGGWKIFEIAPVEQ